MESKTHHNLVKIIYNYVSNYPKVKKELIQSDIFEISGNVIRMHEGYIPDVYYNFNNLIIIGEAKTEKDLETWHSTKQIESYINHLKRYESSEYNTILIIAVPWQASITAYRILKRMISSDNITAIVINELGVYKKNEKNKTAE